MFGQVSVVAQLYLPAVDAFRSWSALSHDNAVLAIVSPLAQVAWTHLRGRQFPPVRMSMLLLSLILGLWGMTAAGASPAAGCEVVILRTLLGLTAWLPLWTRLTPLKLLTLLPTSRTVFGEQIP